MAKRTDVLRGEDVREVLETVLADEALQELMDAAGFQQRQRALHGRAFVRALVISAAQGDGGRQAGALKYYFEEGHMTVARSCQYEWFNEALEATMQGVSDRALTYASGLKPNLPGWLGEHVSDWLAVDSTTVKLDDDLKKLYPGTGDYAALKVHKTFSLGVGTTVAYHLSPAREHDSRHLDIDETWRGRGLLADLGYASIARLEHCEKFDVRYVIRLKDNWKPKVDFIHAGDVTRTFLKGADFDALLDDEVLVLTGPSIDADVRLGSADLPARLVGIEHDGVYRYYLTNLPRTVAPSDIADLYRARWEIEVDNKTDKSCHRLDDISAKHPHTVRALLHASMTATVLINLLAYHHRRREGSPGPKGAQRKRPPIHPQAAAKMMIVMAYRIADAMELTGARATAEWDFIADRLVFMGQDPNWRRRPSVLDRLRGWIVSPGPPRSAKKKKLSRRKPIKKTRAHKSS